MSTQRYRTLHAFLCTSSLLALSIGGLHLLAPAEHALFGGSDLSDNPFPTLMLVLGLPHIVVGLVYSVSSKQMAGVRSRVGLAAGALIGAGLVWLLHRFGGPSGGWRIAVVAVYFLVHTHRDEFQFYRRYGELADPERSCIFLLLVGFYAGLAAVVWTTYLLAGDPAYDLRHTLCPALLARSNRLTLWLPPCLLFCSIALLCVRSAVRRGRASVSRLISRDAPLWWVYVLIPVLWLAAASFGGKFYSIVLLHVVGWWVFAAYVRARARGGATPLRLGLWNWVRTTQTGFQLFHGALVLGVAVLLTYYTHDLGHLRRTAFDWILTPSAFYYWTIVHVTISFAPRSRYVQQSAALAASRASGSRAEPLPFGSVLRRTDGHIVPPPCLQAAE